jgi:hypothetical protein
MAAQPVTTPSSAADPRSSAWFARGVIAPMAIVALAIVVFFRAGAAGSLGPLSLETAYWIVAGIWAAGPAVGGVLSGRLHRDDQRRAAVSLALVIGGLVAFVFAIGARSAAEPTACAVPLEPGALSYLLGCLVVGGVVGVGSGLSLLLASRVPRGPVLLVTAPASWGLALGALGLGLRLYYAAVTCLA